MDHGRPAGGPGVESEVVEQARAQGAPEHEDDLRIRREAKPTASFRVVERPRRRRDRPADGAVLLPVPPERQREEDAVGERRSQAVRETEVGIRLGERARDPLEARGNHHRPRDVTTRAEHRVRLAAAEDRAARDRRREGLAECAQEVGMRPPRQPGDRERVELVPLLRNQLRLDAIRRPGERHDPAPPPQCFRDGECRCDVSDRPPGRDQEPQLLLVRHHGRC